MVNVENLSYKRLVYKPQVIRKNLSSMIIWHTTFYYYYFLIKWLWISNTSKHIFLMVIFKFHKTCPHIILSNIQIMPQIITKEEAIFTKVYPQPLSHISRITRAYSFSQLLRRYPQFTTCNGHPSCSL